MNDQSTFLLHQPLLINHRYKEKGRITTQLIWVLTNLGCSYSKLSKDKITMSCEGEKKNLFPFIQNAYIFKWVLFYINIYNSGLPVKKTDSVYG